MAEYDQCAAAGCIKRPRRWSRYCSTHFRRIQRTGGVNGRTLKAHELRPYREIARGWVDRNREHPAVAAGVDWMAGLLGTGVETAGFLGREFDRLRAAAVEPEEMLAATIAVRLFDEAAVRPFDENGPIDVNTGRAILRCAPQRIKTVAASGRKDGYRTSESHARALGERVREALGALPLVAARDALAEVHEHQQVQAAIREGLQVPFASTDS